MLLCPVQNSAVLQQQWVQARPRITQLFGLNPQIYSRFGMKGHNGLDYGIKVGTPIFAPMDGIVKIKDTGTKGYGLHIKIRSDFKALECVLAHLSETAVADGGRVSVGDLIGLSGNTGFSTGPHLHYGLRRLKPNKAPIFSWPVAEYSNGYYGYFDPIDFTLCWKGLSNKNNL